MGPYEISEERLAELLTQAGIPTTPEKAYEVRKQYITLFAGLAGKEVKE